MMSPTDGRLHNTLPEINLSDYIKKSEWEQQKRMDFGNSKECVISGRGVAVADVGTGSYKSPQCLKMLVDKV